MAVQTLTTGRMASTPAFLFHRLPKRGRHHREEIPVVGIRKGSKVGDEKSNAQCPNLDWCRSKESLPKWLCCSYAVNLQFLN